MVDHGLQGGRDRRERAGVTASEKVRESLVGGFRQCPPERK